MNVSVLCFHHLFLNPFHFSVVNVLVICLTFDGRRTLVYVVCMCVFNISKVPGYRFFGAMQIRAENHVEMMQNGTENLRYGAKCCWKLPKVKLN